MKTSTICIFLASVFMFMGYAFAADAAAPDITGTILALWKAIQDNAPVALILVPVFQLLRTHEVLGLLNKFSGKYIQLIIAVLTTGGFVVDAIVSGKNIGQAIVTGLFTAGGGMLMYDAIRSINKKV